MELHDAEEAIGMRKILAHDMRMKTLSGFVQTFMELCGSKVQLAPPPSAPLPPARKLHQLASLTLKSSLSFYFFKHFVLIDF